MKFICHKKKKNTSIEFGWHQGRDFPFSKSFKKARAPPMFGGAQFCPGNLFRDFWAPPKGGGGGPFFYLLSGLGSTFSWFFFHFYIFLGQGGGGGRGREGGPALRGKVDILIKKKPY